MLKEEGLKYLNSVLKDLAEEMTESELNDFRERLGDNPKVLKCENDHIYVVVKDALAKLLLEKFNSRRMNELLEEESGKKINFKFLTENNARKGERENKSFFPGLDKTSLERSMRKLRSEFTFDNFVVGESNRFAFLTSMKVAESPYSILNPLYIFGDVGLGKTHLMMAIGHYILDKNMKTNVVYTSAQQFVEDFFVYTKKDPGNIEFFYNKYRSADVLLVDDIQFLESKPKTQEEFFKVFDYLHENNKQIIVTSDRKASELNIMSRLKSRFSWGMAVDIKTPDRKLRINILKRKLEYMLTDPNEVPEESLEMIADWFTDNIRELEGALRRFVMYCVSMGVDFSPENARSILESIAPAQEGKNMPEEISIIKKVKDEVCGYFKLNVADLISKSRKPNIVYARNLCFFLIRKKADVSLKKIGESFGNKDHTSVSYGIDKISEALSNDSQVKKDVFNIQNKLEK